jgi:hypothetical protein
VTDPQRTSASAAPDLVSFWIEFGDWPAELRDQPPPYPRECGVTARDLGDALRLIHRGFYEGRELPHSPDGSVGITTMREGLVVACADRVERGRLRPPAAFPVVRGGIMNHQYPLRGQAGWR